MCNTADDNMHTVYKNVQCAYSIFLMQLRVFGQTKNRPKVGHLSEQRQVMLLCNYQNSTTRNELMSAQTADQSVHC